MWRLRMTNAFPHVVCLLLLPVNVVIQSERSNATSNNVSLIDAVQSDTQSLTTMYDVNVIVLLPANDTIFESIYKYLQWMVHDQNLLPTNYRLK